MPCGLVSIEYCGRTCRLCQQGSDVGGSRCLAYFGTHIPSYTVSNVKESFLWEDNINMDLKEVWCDCEECINNVAYVTVQRRAHLSKVMDCGGLS